MTNPKQSSEKVAKVPEAASQELPADPSGRGSNELSEAELNKVAGGKQTHASPKLAQFCATGTHIKEATITH